MKKKICDGCNKEKPIWKNVDGKKLCKTCSYNTTGVAKKSGKSKPKVLYKIPSRSSTGEKLNKAYLALREVYIRKHSLCEAALPGCTRNTQDIHHKKGRGEYLNDTSTWLPVCRTCHTWIELHPEEAITLGYSELRLEKNEHI